VARHSLRGLCETCRHGRVVEARRSSFLMCTRGLSDPGYPKYPVLPVRACRGYEPSAPPEPSGEVS